MTFIDEHRFVLGEGYSVAVGRREKPEDGKDIAE
jgi:hypothetical protein